jgi:hypothetical protein
MAGKVFFSVSMSLDGFIAPQSLEDLMGQQWMELQQWLFPQLTYAVGERLPARPGTGPAS